MPQWGHRPNILPASQRLEERLKRKSIIAIEGYYTTFTPS